VSSQAAPSYPLLAGQTINVGNVTITNDGSNLYVKLNVASPWVLVESHVAVAQTADGIPQKNGNPIPGQFAYSESNGKYVIPLDGLTGKIVIAVHAVVTRAIPGCFETVWQIGYVETAGCEGLPTNYADEFNWGAPAGPCTAGPNLGVSAPAFANPFIVGVTPISQFPYNSNFGFGYATDFDVQWDGALPLGGKLTVSWSPGQSADEQKKVYVNGILKGTFNAHGTPTPGGFLNTYPLVQHSATIGPLADGTQIINFKHTMGDGTFWDWIRLEKPCQKTETAWGDGEDFSGKNWATYIEYYIDD